jgi:hypothetical protein
VAGRFPDSLRGLLQDFHVDTISRIVIGTIANQEDAGKSGSPNGTARLE